MGYAVIKTGGKQYRVEPGDVLRVEKLVGEVGNEIAFDEVLLRQSESGLAIGTPVIEGARVAAVIIGQERERKILVYKKKRRKNYRRRQGHRQSVTTVRVVAVD